MDLFEREAEKNVREGAPLARRMRPRGLEEFAGQEHIVGKGAILRRAIEADRLSSLIFYGPPGCGKTGLAHIIAATTRARFSQLNAVTAGVADLRSLLGEARDELGMHGSRTILFVDEIHRFNKAQQDALMPDVEDGVVILIGATVHNPYFSVNAPLISRSLVCVFQPLSEEDMMKIARRALSDAGRGLGSIHVRSEPGALEHLVQVADGDARKLLNALELGVMTTKPEPDGTVLLTVAVAGESIQKKAPVYDRDGDAHYDVASAFIKSMRGGDPDAVLYWLARMIAGGEDPRFIARRIAIAAAEDVGNADPMALVVANAALQVCAVVGMPEARIPLAQAAVYVATAPKSNASYVGISRALEDAGNRRTVPVPSYLQDANYPGASELGRGKGYRYPHEFPGHLVRQEYLPEKFRAYYEPTQNGYEKEIAGRLDAWRRVLEQEGREVKACRGEGGCGGGPLGAAKLALRSRMLAGRRALTSKEVVGRSRRIQAHLRELPLYRAAGRVLFYLALAEEVQTGLLVREALRSGVTVLVPVTKWKEGKLLISRLEDLDRDVTAGRLGILEPKEDCVRPWPEGEVDLVVVPGVAFDRTGKRLGFGGGFYDKLLGSIPPGVLKVALAFGLQIVKDVPAGEHDVPVDLLVTEEGIIDPRAAGA